MAETWSSRGLKTAYKDVLRQNAGWMSITPPPGVTWSANLVFTVMTFSLPNESYEEFEIPFGNDKIFMAGRKNIEAITVTFADALLVDNTSVGKFLSDWNKKIYDYETRKMEIPVNYKGAAAECHQTDLSGVDIRVWKSEGIWPQATNYGTVDQSGSDRNNIEVTFRVDHCAPFTPFG